MLDGFDLVVLGTVLPTLIKGGLIGFTAAGATAVATLGLVGVAIGAILTGPVSNRLGRRGTLMASVAVFSLATFAIAFAPSVLIFGVLRFIAGLGLGACLPTVLAYVNDFSHQSRAGRSTTLTMTGYHVGAVITALLAIVIVPNWQLMFIIGGALGVVVLAIIWFKLPESPLHEHAAARTDRIADHVRKPYLRISLAVWIASFMGLLLVYGLNTWLPTIMAAAGYAPTASLALLLVLNLGAVAGLILAGSLADRGGIKTVALIWFGLAALFLAALSIRLSSDVLVYIAVFITGVFVFSAQVLIYAYVAQLFPANMRAGALGFAAGVGRMGAIAGPYITGTLVTAGIAYPWGFYTFAIVAAIAVVAIAFLPRRSPVDSTPTTP